MSTAVLTENGKAVRTERLSKEARLSEETRVFFGVFGALALIFGVVLSVSAIFALSAQTVMIVCGVLGVLIGVSALIVADDKS